MMRVLAYPDPWICSRNILLTNLMTGVNSILPPQEVDYLFAKDWGIARGLILKRDIVCCEIQQKKYLAY